MKFIELSEEILALLDHFSGEMTQWIEENLDKISHHELIEKPFQCRAFRSRLEYQMQLSSTFKCLQRDHAHCLKNQINTPAIAEKLFLFFQKLCLCWGILTQKLHEKSSFSEKT
jgi:hypothetical protein